MAVPSKRKKKNSLTKINEIKLDKISAFFKRSILKQITKILLMEHAGYRTFKSVKNINRLFTNIDMKRYVGKPELEAYIWVICFVSKQWLDGVTTPDVIAEMAKNRPEYNSTIGDIFDQAMDNKEIITPPEAKAIFDLIAEALQYGYIASLKDQYIDLLDDIDMNEPGAFKKVVQKLFIISQSLVDIKYNTNLVANKVEFNTADMDSIREALKDTMDSLSSSNAILKTGIIRLNTLLSPGYMNGRLYVWGGLPGSGKSTMLLQSALDIRQYNPGYKTKTPGMKPCVLYITMENTFTETIERMWNMCFDDPMTNYSLDEAVDKLSSVLGIAKITKDTEVIKDDIKAVEINEDGTKNELNGTLEQEKHTSLLDKLAENDKKKEEPNIEIVVQYYPYRSISTDDLFTIINDLREENMECCALVFDYIKRIEPAEPAADNVKLELNRIINELKALAVIQDIPVITAHQMNRAAASAVDNAARAGKSDTVKLAGRENIGDAWEVLETADFFAVLNREYKPGTDQLYLTINVLKRRRIDAAEKEFAKFTYLAHPYKRNNQLALIHDMGTGKVLSLQSLSSDIDVIGDGEKKNAAPRLQQVDQHEFDENY